MAVVSADIGSGQVCRIQRKVLLPGQTQNRTGLPSLSNSGGRLIDSMEETGYELGLHIRFPRNAGWAPLPDAEGDDTGQASWDTSRTVHLDLPVDQLGWIATSLQIVVSFDVMEVGMRHDKGNHRDRQYGDGGVIDSLRA